MKRFFLIHFVFLDYRSNMIKCEKFSHIGEPPSPRLAPRTCFYYRLAPETLPASFDESSYDSLHNYETGKIL